MGGAVVEMGSDGQPTGLVSEIDSMLPINEPELDIGDILRSGAETLYTRFGVTVVGDISGTLDGMRSLAALAGTGDVPQRIQSFLCAPGTVPFDEVFNGAALVEGNSRLRVAGVKVFADGGFSSKNAATWVPYRKPYAVRRGSRGKINLNTRRVASLVRRAADAGLQLAVHANGERAQASVIGAVLVAGVRNGIPVRVEHAGNLLTHLDALTSWRESGIIPMPQPVFLYNFGDFFPTYLGRTASVGRFPFRHIMNEGFELSASSDVYVGAEENQTNPFFGMWCSIARETFLGRRIEQTEALDFPTALRMHTINAARSLGLADDYGSIEAGKRADLVVVDRDPFTVATDDLPHIKVDHVLVSGRLVYSRPGAVKPQISAAVQGS
jgi:predicted amidohydrolase YtcJ